MALKQIPPEEVARADAWVSAIRGLARQHRVAHKKEVGFAIKIARTGNVPMAIQFGVQAGIPREDLVALSTLIFG